MVCGERGYHALTLLHELVSSTFDLGLGPQWMVYHFLRQSQKFLRGSHEEQIPVLCSVCLTLLPTSGSEPEFVPVHAELEEFCLRTVQVLFSAANPSHPARSRSPAWFEEVDFWKELSAGSLGTRTRTHLPCFWR
jgi:hypothetical protein